MSENKKDVTLKDIADEYFRTDQQIINLIETNKTNEELIKDLEKKKSTLFMTVANKVDELSVPKNRQQRRAEERKSKK